jgi:DNA-binding GntR family transcriptional regulator
MPAEMEGADSRTAMEGAWARTEGTVVLISSGQVVSARLPTPRESRLWDISSDTPVLVVDGVVYPSDKYMVVSSGAA